MSTPASTWEDLDRELRCWRRAGRIATLWWRDDDAVGPDAALERLVGMSARWQVPLSLAVIPAELRDELAPVLAHAPRGCALQHGYAHRDHAASDEPSAELGPHRPAAQVLAELDRGCARLREALAAHFVPVLVPPWNRIDPDLVPRLGALGFRGLSCFAPRSIAVACDGMIFANCHVDPVDWRRGGVFRGQARSLSALVAHLRGRRNATVDPDEPTGLLTHHLRHDGDLWSFLEALFQHLCDHAQVRWLDAREVFAG